MYKIIIQLYIKIFAKTYFEKFNKILFRLSIGGMGILNYQSSSNSGEKSFINNFLKGRKGVVIDVGANEGDYSNQISSINSQIDIFAFEPHPKTFNKLINRFHGNEKIVCINKGLSSKSGELTLFDYGLDSGSEHASLYGEVITDLHGSANPSLTKVNLITIDEFILGSEIEEILLLKIDTEGNELEVLKGAQVAINNNKIKMIHFEFNEMNVVSRAFFRDFWKLLNNYSFYRLLPDSLLKIEKYNPLYCEIFAFQNIVAILDERK